MPSVEELSITTIRTLAMDAVQKANSGHPGTAMALAPVAYLLYEEEMRHDPGDPHWPDRDRFVLSAGHACILQYAALHLAGYDLLARRAQALPAVGLEDAGPPGVHHTPGVETTTGPLGQGFGNSVGMALAERMLAARYNRPGHEIVDHRTYCICSDGDLQEGVSGEAVVDRRPPRPRPADVLLRRQPHLDRGRHRPGVHRGRGRALSRLRLARAALRRHVDARRRCAAAVDASADAEPRPSMIILRTHIAPGAPNKQDTPSAHGEPLGADEIRLTKRAYGWPEDATFFVPDEVREHCDRRARGEALAADWRERVRRRTARRTPTWPPSSSATQAGTLPDGWDDAAARVHAGRRRDGDARGGRQGAATRSPTAVPELVGGSADLAPVDQHADRRTSAVVEPGDYERPQLPLRHPRARHGRDR